ncbi:MAG: methyltransferase domain-containing protein [Oscillospiraceae bacterium]|nr:methyltransferase domain-containing protein [Oscillospiraceae bacterium]
MEKSCFICPVCRVPLFKNEKTYTCENGHSFDIAKKGYVNLLMSQKGGQHGDDKTMIAARADFLNRGFYDELSEKICACVHEHTAKGARVIDAGCGECKYTADVFNFLDREGKGAEVIGIDISKEALAFAKRRTGKLHLAVASTADMPVESGSVDAIINVFAPFSAHEFLRVLKDDGVTIRVFPLAKHLWELKALVYDNPYENPEEDMEEDGLKIIGRHRVCYTMDLSTNDDITSLFKMTPYFYRTGERDMEKLRSAERLACRAEFGIAVYRKVTI